MPPPTSRCTTATPGITIAGILFRKVDGDTYCKRRSLQAIGPETDQAWSINAQSFSQHLFDGFLWAACTVKHG